MNPRLIATRGLPGSGKSTKAVAWVAEDVEHRARVNRDSFRAMFHGGWLGTRAQENMVTAVQTAAVRELLAANVDVIVDDTNLRAVDLDGWRRMAGPWKATFEVWDLTDIPLTVCLQRDAHRDEAAQVGEAVIRGMHARYLHHRPLVQPARVTPSAGQQRSCRLATGHCWHPEALIDWWCCMCPAETDGMPPQECTVCGPSDQGQMDASPKPGDAR